MIDKKKNSTDREQEIMEDKDNYENFKYTKRDILGDVTKMVNSEGFSQGSKQNKHYGYLNNTLIQLEKGNLKYLTVKTNWSQKDRYNGEIKKNKYYENKKTNERNKQEIVSINENKENKIKEHFKRHGTHCSHNEIVSQQRTRKTHDEFDFVNKPNRKDERKLYKNDEKIIEIEPDQGNWTEGYNNGMEHRLKPKNLVKRSNGYHMRPYWDKSIVNELDYIFKKYRSCDFETNDLDKNDIYMINEYAPEIYDYLHTLELKLAPNPNYMRNQKEIRLEMRIILIDWVVQVHKRFNLLSETLFLAVNIIDRFLSKKNVSSSRFQLVGAIALFIAAKYEEINCPTVQEVAYMADNIYSVDDFLKAEKFMIEVLEFDMGWPGPLTFLSRILKADNHDYRIKVFAKYFLETTIMDPDFIGSKPSWLAAGSCYLAKKILSKESWSELHTYFSGFTRRQLIPLAERLLENCRDAKKNHNAIFEKYNEKKCCHCSMFVQDYLEALS